MPPELTMFRFAHRTLPALLGATAIRCPERVFLRFVHGEAAPREITFAGFCEMVRRAAAFLEARGVGPQDRVLLLAENSPEWQVFSLAAQLLRAEPVALFASLAAEPAEQLARRAKAAVWFVSNEQQWAKIAPAHSGVRVVVTQTGFAPPDGVEVVAASEVMAWPALAEADFAVRAARVSEDDPFLLLFTSGTTGRQKGVRLAQRSIVCAIDGGATTTGTTESDLGLHLLPFGHIAGHDQFMLAMAQGHGLLMVARRVDFERAFSLGPTYLFSVPIVYDRIRARSLESIEKLPRPLVALVGAALDAAARVRVDRSRRPLDRALAALADRLVGTKVRAALGGRLRALYSGGAPASEALFRFYEGLGIPLVELYGMSETAGLIASNLLGGSRRANAAGVVMPDHEIRFAEDGELCLRGPLLFRGYEDSADNEGAFSQDGYFHTGDLARIDDEGLLRVTGRKKHLVVLSTGKKVAPEAVETVLSSVAPFEGAMILGEGRPFVIAVVFVAREELARLASAGRAAAEHFLPRALLALRAFSDFEKPKRLLVMPGSPDEYPGLVTPTQKLRREALSQLVRTKLEKLYEAVGR